MPKERFFPPAETADSSGLIRLGGDLSPDTLLAAYRGGIFPWPIVQGGQEQLAWWSPNPRAIFELDEFHVSRRLARRLTSGRFTVSINRDFAGVVAGCAQPRGRRDGVWITPSLAEAYQVLHELGHAHSIETWRGGKLVGGVYGVAVGGLFAGESMFYRETDASKVALAHLVERLRERGYSLFDIQFATPHTLGLGAREIARRQYLRRLKLALPAPATFVD